MPEPASLAGTGSTIPDRRCRINTRELIAAVINGRRNPVPMISMQTLEGIPQTGTESRSRNNSQPKKALIPTLITNGIKT
tara:strand:+ start:1218 stop:1457 length:240 start_codon:yes stop_codon:yes gene_type:complete